MRGGVVMDFLRKRKIDKKIKEALKQEKFETMKIHFNQLVNFDEEDIKNMDSFKELCEKFNNDKREIVIEVDYQMLVEKVGPFLKDCSWVEYTIKEKSMEKKIEIEKPKQKYINIDQKIIDAKTQAKKVRENKGAEWTEERERFYRDHYI